jgi:hypothetical protein
MRWFAHFKHSSVMKREAAMELQAMAQRSWLKLLRMTWMPLFSSPSRFSTGTFTLSKVM